MIAKPVYEPFPSGAIRLEPRATVPEDLGFECMAFMALTWARAVEVRDWLKGQGFESSAQLREVEAFGVESKVWYIVGLKGGGDGGC